MTEDSLLAKQALLALLSCLCFLPAFSCAFWTCKTVVGQPAFEILTMRRRCILALNPQGKEENSTGRNKATTRIRDIRRASSSSSSRPGSTTVKR